MSTANLIIETRNNVLLMGLNRPEKRNALTVEMFYGLAEAYAELDRNPELRCGLLYAVGDHFTGGLDLPQWGPLLASGKRDLPEGMLDPYGLDPSSRCKKPVVMAVQGICFTFGVELLLASDIRIAAKDVRLALLEVKRGIFPCGGATIRLFREIGWGHAMRYILTGDELNGPEAYRLGLVQELVEPGQQFDRAWEIAQKVALAAPLGVQAALASSRKARDFGDAAAGATVRAEMIPIKASQDSNEGLQAFLERREPKFSGK